MKFWDSSAVVPLCVKEPQSSASKAILDQDSSLVVWWATRIECLSAIVRQTREGGITPKGARNARRALEILANAWTEVLPTEPLRQAAEHLLGVHSLRAADALQLAAALQWCRRQTAGSYFVSFDNRLRDAAEREGFALLPEELYD